jgi:hypothetical protein
MKTKLILLMLVLGFSTFSQAQKIYNPLTGDSELDGILKDIDRNAKNNLIFFEKDVTTKFNIAKSAIDKVIKIMPPGDIYMAAQLSFLLGKPFEIVIKTYNLHKNQGWGAIAKEMGIKPGSAEFHNMKKALKSNGNKNRSAISHANDHSKSEGAGNGNGNKSSKGKGKKK